MHSIVTAEARAKEPATGAPLLDHLWQAARPRTGHLGRHHILDGSLQRAVVRAGVVAGLDRAIHCHTFRHKPAGLARRGEAGRARCRSTAG